MRAPFPNVPLTLRLLVTAAMLCALTWFALAGALLTAPATAPEGQWEAIVVLGCSVNDDGEPSAPLRARVEHAVGLWESGRAPVIVFTGGENAGGDVEAVAAAAYAMRYHSVPANAIALEGTSHSTWENATGTWELHPYRQVLVVTEHYHAYRSRRVFRRVGFTADVDSVASNPQASWIGALREVGALGYYALHGRL